MARGKNERLTFFARPWLRLSGGLVCLGSELGCAGSAEAPPAPPCEQPCQDSSAVRALREMMKLAYNLTLQGNPVGAQDEITPCPLGGGVRVFGMASSNAEQGATEVDLTYTFVECAHLERDEEPEENYSMTLTGELEQSGIIAVQPSAHTGLLITSESVSLTGTVYDPPLEYEEPECAVELGQNGDNVSGNWCGRVAGVDL